MYKIKEKERNYKVEVAKSLIAKSIKDRSLDPVKPIFHKVRYGKNYNLEGGYFDYVDYERRMKKPVNFVVGR